MKEDGAWGDHIVLVAAAKCFKVPINIITSSDLQNKVIRINPTLDPGEHTVNPLVLGHVAEHHYISLEPVPGELCSYVRDIQKCFQTLMKVTRCFMPRLYGNQLLVKLMTSFN